MKFLFVLCLAALASASDVLDLTTENFDATVAENSPILVEFYAPWCGHCKSLAPEYEKAATALKEHNIKIAKVDATVHEQLAQRFSIQGFPTLKLFKGGKVAQDYQGPRSAEGITAFMIKKSGDPYTKVASAEEAEAILAKETHGVVLGFFTDFDSDDFIDFKAAADASQNVRYLLVSDSNAAEGCLPSFAEGSIAVFAKDGSKHVFAGEDVEEDLPAFVQTHAFAQSTDLDPELFSSFLKSGIVLVAAYDFNAENAAEFRALATRAAAAHPSLKQMFADTGKWQQALVRMGVVSGNVFPTFVAFSGNGAAPISWDEEVAVTEESLNSWLVDVVAGTAVTWKKSEPIPESNDGPVIVVVHKTFEQIVLNKEKDVLVEFYAPWCGHCKNLEPIYNEVGQHFANDNNIVIAKMDATANYNDPALGVRGYPTLKFFPAGEDAEVLEYEGDRTKEDIIEFVSSNRNSQA